MNNATNVLCPVCDGRRYYPSPTDETVIPCICTQEIPPTEPAPKLKTFMVPVTYTETCEFEVRAYSKEEAIKVVEDDEFQIDEQEVAIIDEQYDVDFAGIVEVTEDEPADT